jgi:hypothetical protein
MGTFPYKRVPIRECRHLDRIDYQRAGARMSPAVALIDPALIPDPAAALAEKLGPLAWATVPNPAASAAVADIEKLAKRAKLQAGRLLPDPHGAAPEVVSGYGNRLASVVLFPASKTCASVSGVWMIKQPGLPRIEMMEMTGMVPTAAWPEPLIPAPVHALEVAGLASPLEPGVQTHG